MILDLVGFISTHFQPKPSHGDPFQADFSKICNPDFWVNLEMSNENPIFDFLVDTLRGVDPSKKMSDVGTSLFHPFSRRELRYVSENGGLCFWKWS